MRKFLPIGKTAAVLAVLLFAASCCRSKADRDFEARFVTLTDAVPDAILEIRYFSTFNFVGTRIDGYLEPTALLSKEAAKALREVPYTDTYFNYPIRQIKAR